MHVNLDHGIRPGTDGAVVVTGPKGRYTVTKCDTSGYFRVSLDIPTDPGTPTHTIRSSHPDKAEALYAACRLAGLDD